MKVSIKVQLYKHKTLSDGTHPILLILSKNRRRRKFSIGVSCRVDEWNSGYQLIKPSVPQYDAKNELILNAKSKAHTILDRFRFLNHDFSIEEFTEQYKGIESGDVFSFFENRINQLNSTDKVGYAIVHQETLSVIKKFHGKKELSFNEVNYNFLESLEYFLRLRGNVETTISIRMRTLRSIYNLAIKKKYCSPDSYPFNDYEISKLKGSSGKRYISRDDILKIESYTSLQDHGLALSIDLFLFSYYNMGMNFTDMAQLKWSNVSKGRIKYTRQKTGKKYNIKVLAPVQKILNNYQGDDGNDKFVFPILTIFHETSKEKKIRIKSVLKQVNTNLKCLGLDLGIEQKLTTYVARHSWAMTMKNLGVSVALISEGLGHSTEKTTQIYLDQFGNEMLDEINEYLLK